MAGMKVLLKKLQCKRCGWEWAPRKPVVYLCPHCKSPKWHEEKEKKSDPGGLGSTEGNTSGD